MYGLYRVIGGYGWVVWVGYGLCGRVIGWLCGRVVHGYVLVAWKVVGGMCLNDLFHHECL